VQGTGWGRSGTLRGAGNRGGRGSCRGRGRVDLKWGRRGRVRIGKAACRERGGEGGGGEAEGGQAEPGAADEGAAGSLTLHGLARRMARLADDKTYARQLQRGIALRFIAAVASRLGAERVLPYLPLLMRPLYRITEPGGWGGWGCSRAGLWSERCWRCCGWCLVYIQLSTC